MNRLITLGAAALVLALASPLASAQDRRGDDRDGRWWRGRNWRQRDRYDVNARLTRLEITDARSGRSLDGDVITLTRGESIELRALGYADGGRRTSVVTVHPSWRLPDSAPAVLTDHGETATLTARGGNGEVYELAAVEGNLSTVLRFRVAEPERNRYYRPSWGNRFDYGRFRR